MWKTENSEKVLLSLGELRCVCLVEHNYVKDGEKEREEGIAFLYN